MVAASKQGQLLATSNDAAATRTFMSPTLHPGYGCTKIYTAPAGHSFILQQVTFDVSAAATSAGFAITTAASCATLNTAGSLSGLGSTTISLGAGLVIAAGHSLYGEAIGNITLNDFGLGYLVPSAQAPTTTPG